MVWIGLIWLAMGTCGGLLWTQHYIFGRKKNYFVTSWIMIIFTCNNPLCVNDITKWSEYQSQHNCTFIRQSEQNVLT